MTAARMAAIEKCLRGVAAPTAASAAAPAEPADPVVVRASIVQVAAAAAGPSQSAGGDVPTVASTSAKAWSDDAVSNASSGDRGSYAV